MTNEEFVAKVRELLGLKVTYVRLDEKNEVQTGEASVRGIFIAADGRPQVRIDVGSGAVNADAAAINLVSGNESTYIEGALAIRKRADEINSYIKQVTTSGNAELETMYDQYIGTPIVL